jgi:hypothetical protein
MKNVQGTRFVQSHSINMNGLRGYLRDYLWFSELGEKLKATAAAAATLTCLTCTAAEINPVAAVTTVADCDELSPQMRYMISKRKFDSVKHSKDEAEMTPKSCSRAGEEKYGGDTIEASLYRKLKEQ